MKLNISGKITQYFINSQLTVLLMAATAVLGLFALAFTPREENPQITVPAANVMVMMPGAAAKEVEELVSKPLQAKLWEIPGVEDVYSVSMNSMSVVTVKFYVGRDKERSLVKLYDKLMSNRDFAPPGASQPLVKPIDVDDVPIVSVALSASPGTGYDDARLRLVADNVLDELRKVPGVGNAVVIGGRSRQVRVTLDPQRIAGYGLSPLAIVQAILAQMHRCTPTSDRVRGKARRLASRITSSPARRSRRWRSVSSTAANPIPARTRSHPIRPSRAAATTPCCWLTPIPAASSRFTRPGSAAGEAGRAGRGRSGI